VYPQAAQSLKYILKERATILARETGYIKRQRKFSEADLLQTLALGWLGHPDASLEQLSSVATLQKVKVTDTAVHKRITEECAQFLHAMEPGTPPARWPCAGSEASCWRLRPEGCVAAWRSSGCIACLLEEMTSVAVQADQDVPLECSQCKPGVMFALRLPLS
jgi:hypothetical protein